MRSDEHATPRACSGAWSGDLAVYVELISEVVVARRSPSTRTLDAQVVGAEGAASDGVWYGGIANEAGRRGRGHGGVPAQPRPSPPPKAKAGIAGKPAPAGLFEAEGPQGIGGDCIYAVGMGDGVASLGLQAGAGNDNPAEGDLRPVERSNCTRGALRTAREEGPFGAVEHQDLAALGRTQRSLGAPVERFLGEVVRKRSWRGRVGQEAQTRPRDETLGQPQTSPILVPRGVAVDGVDRPDCIAGRPRRRGRGPLRLSCWQQGQSQDHQARQQGSQARPNVMIGTEIEQRCTHLFARPSLSYGFKT